MDCRTHPAFPRGVSMPPDLFEPAELLRLADAHLRSLQPARQTSFHHRGRLFRARFDYPGLVLVFDGATGALHAKSLPGRPTKPAKLGGRPDAAA